MKYKYNIGDTVIIPVNKKELVWSGNSRDKEYQRKFIIIGRFRCGVNKYSILIDVPSKIINKWEISKDLAKTYGILPKYIGQHAYYTEEEFIVNKWERCKKCLKL